MSNIVNIPFNINIDESIDLSALYNKFNNSAPLPLNSEPKSKNKAINITVNEDNKNSNINDKINNTLQENNIQLKNNIIDIHEDIKKELSYPLDFVMFYNKVKESHKIDIELCYFIYKFTLSEFNLNFSSMQSNDKELHENIVSLKKELFDTQTKLFFN